MVIKFLIVQKGQLQAPYHVCRVLDAAAFLETLEVNRGQIVLPVQAGNSDNGKVIVTLQDLQAMDDMVNAGLGVRDAAIDQAGGDNLQVVHDYHGFDAHLVYQPFSQPPYILHGGGKGPVNDAKPPLVGLHIEINLRGHFSRTAGSQAPAYIHAGRRGVGAGPVVLPGVITVRLVEATGKRL